MMRNERSIKEWQKKEGKETERRKVREKGMMRNERLI